MCMEDPFLQIQSHFSNHFDYIVLISSYGRIDISTHICITIVVAVYFYTLFSPVYLATICYQFFLTIRIATSFFMVYIIYISFAHSFNLFYVLFLTVYKFHKLVLFQILDPILPLCYNIIIHSLYSNHITHNCV